MRSVLAVVAFVGFLLNADFATAHGRLINPPPRSNADGIKSAPCGGIPKGTPKATWVAGSTVQITWEETIDHPGRYMLALSPAGDMGFQQNVISANLPDMQGANTLPHRYSHTFVVPNTPGQTWTLQWIQSMEENPASPSYYYSCADIQIIAGPGSSPTPAPTPTATPGGTASPTPPGATPPKSTPPVSGGGSGNQTTLSSNTEFQRPGMGGCGRVVAAAAGGSAGPQGPFGGPMAGLLMALPFAFLLVLRRRYLQAFAKIRSK